MKITALDIRKQEFARTFRGYDPDEVDSFMQVVATGWQEMVDDLRRSQEKIDEQRMKLEHYMKVEEALEEALKTARSSARQTIESAEKKATDLLEDAENRIVSLQKEADANRLEIKRETARYAVRQQEIVAKLRSFLVSEMEMLRHFEADTGERTLQQPTSLREIEMYRDEEAASADGIGDVSENSDSKNISTLEASEAPAAETDTDETVSDESTTDHGGQESAWEDDDVEESHDEPEVADLEDEYEEDDWDEEEEIEESDEGGHDYGTTNHESSNYESVDDDSQRQSNDFDVDEEDEQEDAPGWRVTPVFESAEDEGNGESHASDLDALPDDGADDEIKKIHEILKGLDEEQDADEDEE